MTRILIALLFASSLAAGCGVKGDLETPPPMWGDQQKSDDNGQDTNSGS